MFVCPLAFMHVENHLDAHFLHQIELDCVGYLRPFCVLRLASCVFVHAATEAPTGSSPESVLGVPDELKAMVDTAVNEAVQSVREELVSSVRQVITSLSFGLCIEIFLVFD